MSSGSAAPGTPIWSYARRVKSDPDRAHIRLAELLAALSLGIDLGFGQPMEHVLRQCLIALRLAELAGLDYQQRAVVYYTALLINIGCHTDAHEQAKWFGDDIAVKAVKYAHAPGLGAAAAGMRRLGAGNPAVHRFRLGLEFALSGHREVDDMFTHHAEMAMLFGEQLGLPEPVTRALSAAYEQWDGRGWPGKLKGQEVPVASRLGQLAEFVEVAHRLQGVEGAKQLARKRLGKQFDPSLARLFCDQAETILFDLDSIATWQAVIDAEPGLAVELSEETFDAALLAIANFVDLKSPYFLGHSSAVAELVTAASAQMGLTETEQGELRRAALVCGLGRLGVSNAIWDKRGPLGAGERERARMHPYLTERMLRQSEALAPMAAIAVQHRERLDGSGYPRGLAGGMISRSARILAVADVYQAMREPRPHRPALTPTAAATQLRAEVKAGRLDADAVEAVLGAAGHRVLRRPEGSAGLTPREVEVLRLLVRGLPNRGIAEQLVITPKTVENHVEHIYAKIEASNRAGASLFAMRHGLFPEEQLVAYAAV